MTISAVTQKRIEPVDAGGFVRVLEFTPVSFKPLTAIRYQLPQDTFEHRETTEQITLTASLKDGSALSFWLSFSSTELLFTGMPLEGSASIVVVIVAIDSDGNQVSTEVVVDIEETS